MSEDLTVVDQDTMQTGFTITNVTGTEIDFEFATMAGNQPGNYGNTVFIWQTSAQQVPRNTPPDDQTSITENQPDGSNGFTGLQVTTLSYLVGYAVGPNVNNICATAFIPSVSAAVEKPGANGGLVPPYVQVGKPGQTSLNFSFGMPPGSAPQADLDWAGLWEGQDESALYGTPPNWSNPIPLSSYSGQSTFNNIKLLRDTTYTVGYFKGGWNAQNPKQTTLACSTTFTV